jgi:hypothetical protein
MKKNLKKIQTYKELELANALIFSFLLFPLFMCVVFVFFGLLDMTIK